MKLKHLFIGGLIAGLSGFTVSCSDDMMDDDSGKILPNETTTYVRVSLMGEGMSRADAEYELGTGDESMVKEILLTFFDAGRNYVGKTLITVNEDNTIDVPGAPNTVERILTVVAPVNMPENINYPKYVIAYVNPTSAHADLATDKCEDAMKVIRQRAEVSPNGARTMNNSMYYSSETGYVRFATEVDFKNQFYETKEEAEKATASAIEITVERMEAKVRLSNAINDLHPNDFKSNSGLTGDDGEVTKYTLAFVPEAWFVNGTEKRSFLLKNYRSSRVNVPLNGQFTETDFGMNLTALQDAFKVNAPETDLRYRTVNDAENLRSYWAIDPTYFTSTGTEDLYPDVSFDVQYGTINPNATLYPLTYRSYDSVLKEWAAHTSTNYIKYNGNAKSHEYVLENTMSYNTLNSTDALASMTSVVLLGHYVVTNGAGTVVFDGTTTDKTKSFYVRHEADSKKYVMISDTEAMDFFLERGGSTLFVQSIDKDGNRIDNTFEPLRAAHLKDSRYGVNYTDFQLVYPSADVADKKLSEQWRTMTLKEQNKAYNPNIYVYDSSLDSGNGGYRSVAEADMTTLRKTLFSTYGVLEKFQTGKAYFNVPLKHIWGAGTSSNKFDAKNVILGDFGVVRNHIYDLTINKIEGLGTGIGEITQPIVPPTENEQYYISTRLRILQWRLVKQNVDL